MGRTRGKKQEIGKKKKKGVDDGIKDLSLSDDTDSHRIQFVIDKRPSESVDMKVEVIDMTEDDHGNITEHVDLPFMQGYIKAATKTGKKKNKKTPRSDQKGKQKEVVSEDELSESLVQDYLLNASDIEMEDLVFVDGPDDSENSWDESDSDVDSFGSIEDVIYDSHDSDGDTETHFDDDEDTVYVENIVRLSKKAGRGSYTARSAPPEKKGSFKARLERSNNKGGRSSFPSSAPNTSYNKTPKNDVNALFEKYLLWLQGTDRQFAFPPLPKSARKYFHVLVHKTGSDSISKGKDRDRFTVVTRTEDTRPLPPRMEGVMRRNLERLKPSMNGFQSGKSRKEMKKQKPGKAAYSKARKRGETGKKSNQSESGPSGLKHGAVIGGNADPIGEGNKGHSMLLRMGWKPGDSIGTTSADVAIKKPIEVVFRQKQRGLGY